MISRIILALIVAASGVVAADAVPAPSQGLVGYSRSPAITAISDEMRSPRESERLREERSGAKAAEQTREYERTRALERRAEGRSASAEDQTDRRGKFVDTEKLEDHWNRHGQDFGATSELEYERQADRFLNGPKTVDIQEKTRVNGDRIRFNDRTAEYGVAKSDDSIRTYFKADPEQHGFETNQEYFDAQK